jgi:hypothetical protein
MSLLLSWGCDAGRGGGEGRAAERGEERAGAWRIRCGGGRRVQVREERVEGGESGDRQVVTENWTEEPQAHSSATNICCDQRIGKVVALN